MSAVVDARFAGGHLEVTTEQPDWIEHQLVAVDGPGFHLQLFAHEARALASSLIAAARDADHPKRVRRPHDVDDHLRGLDD